MKPDSKIWKKGKGKLGLMEPLLGTWIAVGNTEMGKLKCTRTITKVLSGNYLEMTVKWEMEKMNYEELAIIGSNEGKLEFWSFTSDGKRSQGQFADGTDIHPEAICFEAKMPAGIARMIYWPESGEAFHWAVEAKNKKGWKRFTEHHYSRQTETKNK
jgi:hypothetical protein